MLLFFLLHQTLVITNGPGCRQTRSLFLFICRQKKTQTVRQIIHLFLVLAYQIDQRANLRVKRALLLAEKEHHRQQFHLHPRHNLKQSGN